MPYMMIRRLNWSRKLLEIPIAAVGSLRPQVNHVSVSVAGRYVYRCWNFAASNDVLPSLQPRNHVLKICSLPLP